MKGLAGNGGAFFCFDWPSLLLAVALSFVIPASAGIHFSSCVICESWHDDNKGLNVTNNITPGLTMDSRCCGNDKGLER